MAIGKAVVMICLGAYEKTQMVDRLIVRELDQVQRMQRGTAALCLEWARSHICMLGISLDDIQLQCLQSHSAMLAYKVLQESWQPDEDWPDFDNCVAPPNLPVYQ